jgi:hypothetical protein
MSNNHHRLRKYQRKKDRARWKPEKWNRLAALYWRYWHKVYGPHQGLWAQEGD